MNKVIADLLAEGPKLKNISLEVRQIFETGFELLGMIVSDNFFDIPVLPDERFSNDGLFYNTSYFHDETIWYTKNMVSLLSVWEMENRESFCPISIDFKIVESQDVRLVINLQKLKSPMRLNLVRYTAEGEYHSQLENPTKITLSQIVNYQNEILKK